MFIDSNTKCRQQADVSNAKARLLMISYKNATYHSLIYHQKQSSLQAVKLHNVQQMHACLHHSFINRILSINILKCQL